MPLFRRKRNERAGGQSSPFTLDGDPLVRTVTCDSCGTDHDTVTGFVLREGDAHAIYYAQWHPSTLEAYIDVICGPFIEPSYPGNVTFGCRVGHIPTQAEPACTLVRGAEGRPNTPIFGTKLERDEALAHPLLSEFWNVVDWLIVNDPTLHANVFHMPPSERAITA